MPANSHLTLGGSSWSGNPPLATVRQLISTSSGLADYTTTTSNVLQGEIDAIVAGGTTALWANYAAIQAVDLSGNNLSNAATITATSFVGALTGNSAGTHTGAVVGNVTGNTNGTHTGAVVGNVTGSVVGNLSNASLTLNSSNSMTLTNNRGSDVGGNSVVDINANFGAATRINLNANAASAVALTPTSQINLTAAGNSVPVSFNPIGGKITLTANAGSGAGSGVLGYGEIDLTANSSGLYAGVIKLSAGANMIYSGTATPYFGLYGQNTMYGLTANALIAGTPPVLPTLVGTNYFYGALGIGGSGLQIVGNRFQGGVGIDFLQPFPNGDLIIQSNANGTDTVVISGVKSLAMSNGGNITGVGNINLTTINNAAYPPPNLTDPTFNSVSTNRISTGAALISSINGLPMSAYTNVGDATFNSVSTNQISTGASFISSINGLPMSAYTNVGDATFNSVSANRISTARISISSINDSIYFGNQPIGNDIAGINDLAAATGTFNTSLNVNGSLTAGTTLLGATRATGLFRVTNGVGANVATIDTAGAITGTSIAVSGAATITGAASAGSLAVTNSATIGNGLSVTGGTTLVGTTTAGLVQGTTMTFTNANVTNANLTNTNTGIINAGAGSLALTYGSISFNGSPYAPTATTSSNATFNSISTNSISTAEIFISSINGYEYVPGGGALPPGIISTPNLLGLVSTPNLAGLISTPNLLGLISTLNLAGLLSTYVSSFTDFNISSLFASSIQVRGGLNFSTSLYSQNGQYDINKTYYLISSSYDAVSTLQNNILNYTYTLGLPAGALVSWAFPPSANLTLVWDEVGTWGSNLNTIAHADPGVNQKQVQISLPNEVYGGTPVAGTFCDWYNQWNVTKMTLYNIGFAPIVDIPWKSTYRVTWTGTSWTVNTSPSPIATTNTTNFNISQNIHGAAISTSDVLTLTGTSIYMNAETMYAGNIEASNIDVVSISSFTGNISSMTSYITASDYINAYSTTTTYGRSQSLSNTGTISTLHLGVNDIVANYVTVNSNLTAPSITVPSGSFSTLTTNNITNYDTITSLNVNVVGTAANGYLYADSAYTSTFGIQSGLAFPNTLSRMTYSNVEALSNGNVLNVPTTIALMHNENMYISSPNPTYTYTGTGVVTFKTDGTVDIAGTPLTTFGWQQGTFTATNPMTLNVSTPTANAFASNARVANLITGAVGTIAFYTSGGGFAGNIPQSTSLSLIYNTSLMNFTTGTFGALAPILFQSYIQTKQSLQSIETITNISTINNSPYIGFGSKGYQIDTFQIKLEGFLISKTAPNGGAYGFADNGSRITNPITGRTYLLSEWNCIVSLAGHNCYRQVTLAVNEAIVTTQNDGGYWKAQAYMTTATIPLLPGGTNFVYWTVAVTMIPIAMGGITGLQTATLVGDVIPSTVEAFNPWAIDTPLAHLSTVTASTFQVIAGTNISLNANLGFPTFLNDGTVSINASTNVDLMANYDITLGAAHDIDMTASSTISLTAPRITAGTAVIGTPSGYGTNYAYFGNNSLAANGGEYALLQENNGRTFLNSKLYQPLNLRNGNYDIMILDDTQIQAFKPLSLNSNLFMNNRTIYNANELYNNNIDLLLTGIGRNITIQTVSAGNINITAPSTNQIVINQTSGSDFVLFDSGDTRMRAVRDAYVEGVRDTYLLANQNMNIRSPHTQYVTIQQTGAANDSFIQLQPSGVIDQFSRGDMSIRCLSTNNITLSHTGAGNQSYFQLTPAGYMVLNARTYFETIAPSGIYFTSPFTELRGYLTFNTSNNYLNNVRHIYGDIGGGGGGLAIDYMYGMFFNGTGRNANFYIDSGNLNMINYNSGINIANYNSNGTGNLSLYCASNDMYIATGTGRDININGGRYVSVNAAQPGGAFGIYASTINATTLLDTNMTIGQNLNITATGSAQLRASYFNFFNDCYFNNRNLHDMQNIYFGFGAYISRNTPGGYSNAFLDIIGAGGDGQLRLINGSAEVALRANSDLGITPTSGYNIVLNGAVTANSNINMNGKSITNVSTISMTSNATITSPDTINLTAPSTFMTGSLYFNPASTSEIDLRDGYLRNASYITNPYTTNIQAFTGLYLTSDVRVNLTASNVRIQGDVDHVNCNVSFISQLRSLSTINNNIDVVNLNIDAPSTIISGTVQRILSARNVTQPVIQYDTVASSGINGSVVVNLPVAYTSGTSYVAFVCMEDADPAEMSCVRIGSASIEIYWQQAGSGSHTIAWQTIGT